MEYIEIGYTKKAQGLKGAIKVHIFDKYYEDFLQAEVVFIDLKNQKIPYFIESIEEKNDLSVKFDEVDSKEAIQKIGSKTISLRKQDIIPDAERTLEQEGGAFYQVVGFEMWDVEKGKLGIIEEIREFPQQEMAIILINNKEVLIPMHSNLIKEINGNDKKIVMELPEGLMEL